MFINYLVQYSSLLVSVLLVVGSCVIQINNIMLKRIADFDACSLYPSAVYFMSGCLKGLPNILSDTSYEFLKHQDEYFLRIKIIKLNKHLDFPLTSKIDEDSGARDFTNDMDNAIIYIDKAGLEDLITFHDAEFEITGGYYYNEGRSNKINHVIKDLYDLRKKLRKITQHRLLLNYL